MKESLILIVIFISLAYCASFQAFSSSEESDFAISTSPIQSISTKPLQNYNYVIDGITYYIRSTNKLTIDQVKQKLNNSKQMQQTIKDNHDQIMTETNKHIQSMQNLFSNMHQNMQNQFRFFKK
jgi:hypothetical protein